MRGEDDGGEENMKENKVTLVIALVALIFALINLTHMLIERL
jgi:hypothetical protein